MARYRHSRDNALLMEGEMPRCLYEACSKGDLNQLTRIILQHDDQGTLAQLLLSRRKNKTALHVLIGSMSDDQDWIALIKTLVEFGCSVDSDYVNMSFPPEIDDMYPNGCLESCDQDVADYARGAFNNRKAQGYNIDGWTALHQLCTRAAYSAHLTQSTLAIMKLLLEHGANPAPQAVCTHYSLADTIPIFSPLQALRCNKAHLKSDLFDQALQLLGSCPNTEAGSQLGDHHDLMRIVLARLDSSQQFTKLSLVSTGWNQLCNSLSTRLHVMARRTSKPRLKAQLEDLSLTELTYYFVSRCLPLEEQCDRLSKKPELSLDAATAIKKIMQQIEESNGKASLNSCAESALGVRHLKRVEALEVDCCSCIEEVSLIGNYLFSEHSNDLLWEMFNEDEGRSEEEESWLSSLEHLRLFDCRMRDVFTVLSNLRSGQQLRTLQIELRAGQRSSEQASVLLQHIGRLDVSNLIEVRLMHCGLDPTTLPSLTEQITGKCLPRLEQIDLRFNQGLLGPLVRDVASVALLMHSSPGHYIWGSCLIYNPIARKSESFWHAVYSAPLQAFLMAVGQSGTVKSLDLRGNLLPPRFIVDQVVAILDDPESVLQNLGLHASHHVEWRACTFQSTDRQATHEYHKENAQAAVRIGKAFARKGIPHKEMEVCSVRRADPWITCIHHGYTPGIGGGIMALLGQFIDQMYSLDLAATRLEASGVSVLAELLCDLRLEKLNLRDTQVCNIMQEDSGDYFAHRLLDFFPQGIRDLAATVAVHAVLKELDLSQNYLGYKGASAVALMLSSNTLQKLNCSHCEITSVATHWHSPPRSSIQAQELPRDSGRLIEYFGLSELAAALKTNTSLTSLDLSGNRIDGRGVFNDLSGTDVSPIIDSLGRRVHALETTGSDLLAAGLIENSTLIYLSLSDSSCPSPATRGVARCFAEEYSRTHPALKSGRLDWEMATPFEHRAIPLQALRNPVTDWQQTYEDQRPAPAAAATSKISPCELLRSGGRMTCAQSLERTSKAHERVRVSFQAPTRA